MRNPTNDEEVIWTEDIDGQTLTFREKIRQPYTNCVYSAGEVFGHPIDTLYFRLTRGDYEYKLLLRPDEAAAIAWVMTSVTWSVLLSQLDKEAK